MIQNTRRDLEWENLQLCIKCKKPKSLCKCKEMEELRKEYKELGLL